MGKIARMTDVSGLTSISAILAASRTNFGTHTEPLHLANGSVAEDFRAVVRDDTGAVLGVTGERYRANPHAAQLGELQPLLDSGFLQPAHVAEWDGGSRLAFQFRCPDLDSNVGGGGDSVSPLLTLAFGHDGKFSDRTFLARFRWFCKNQMGLVRSASQGAQVRHVGSNVERFADLVQAKVLAMSGQVADDAATMRRMRDVTLKGRELLGFFGTGLGVGEDALPAVVDDVWTNGKSPERLRGAAKVIHSVVADYRADATDAPGSVWHAYNGLTRYVTHSAGRSEARRSEALLGSPVIEAGWDAATALVRAA